MTTLDVLFLKILDDIASTRPINPIDREELRLILKDTDEVRHTVGTWTNGKGNINVSTIKAREGDFEISPIQALSVYYSNTTPIPNDTETALVQSGWGKIYGNSKLFRINGDKIEVTYPSRVIGIFGLGNWAESATGRRSLVVKGYDNNDVLLGGATLYSFKGSGLAGVPDVFPGMSWLTSFGSLSYLKLFAYQNSGGALDLEYYELTVFAIL